MERTGYDLGGAECPWDPDYTVVDIAPIPDYVEDVTGHGPKEYDHIKMDLRQDFANLPARDKIRAGQVIRYLQDEGGYLVSSPIEPELFRTFGHRLFRIWNRKGPIDLFDHIALLELVVQGIWDAAHEQNCVLSLETEMVNWPDEDLAGDWSVIITCKEQT